MKLKVFSLLVLLTGAAYSAVGPSDEEILKASTLVKQYGGHGGCMVDLNATAKVVAFLEHGAREHATKYRAATTAEKQEEINRDFRNEIHNLKVDNSTLHEELSKIYAAAKAAQ